MLVTHVIFSHVVTSLHRLKAKGTKPANEMGSSQEYNVQNMISQETMILYNDNALYRDFSTLIPILKNMHYCILLHFLIDCFNMYQEWLRLLWEPVKPGSLAPHPGLWIRRWWFKFLCSFPSPFPKAYMERFWMVSQVSVSVCCSCHVSLFNMCHSGRAYLKSHLVMLDGFPECSQTSINYSQMCCCKLR